MQAIGVLLPVHRKNPLEFGAIFRSGVLEYLCWHFGALRKAFHVACGVGPGGHAGVHRGEQRVGAQSVGAVLRVVALAGGEQPGDAGLLVQPHPKAAHGIVHAGGNAHRNLARIIAHELLVDVQDALELCVQRLCGDVRNVQVHHVLPIDAQVLVHAHVEDLARGDVARHQVAVGRVFLFQEVPGLAVLVRPHAAAFAAGAFAHQAVLVEARYGGGVYLDELTVRVQRALAVAACGGITRVDSGIGGLAEYGPAAARGDDHRIGGEGAHLHGGKVLRGHAAADAVMRYGGNELPANERAHLALNLQGAHLLVERVEQLLAGGGAGECGAPLLGAAESAQVKQAFRRTVEHHAHAVEKVHDAWRRFAHAAHLRLVGQEIAAVDGVVEMLVHAVAFALGVQGRVDAALCAGGMRALEGHQREQVNLQSGFHNFERCHKPGKAAAYNGYSSVNHE